MPLLKGCVIVVISLICLASVCAQAPLLNSLVYSEHESLVRIYGSNFGFNSSIVRVELDGFENHVVGVNDSVINCHRHGKHNMYGGLVSVHVEVNGQHARANLTLYMEATKPVGVANIFGHEDSNIVPQSSLMKFRIVLLACIPALAGVIILGIFLVTRKRKTMMGAHPTASADISVEQAPKTDNHAIVVKPPSFIVRDTSMEEIDLNADDVTPQLSQITSPGIYSFNRSASSSSFSSLSSTYSSTNCSPSSCTPDQPSSPKLDSSDNNTSSGESGDNNTRDSKHSAKREKAMSSMTELDGPVSRLAKRAMDSPYFVKQSAFDSPLTTSQGITPSVTPTQQQQQQQSKEDNLHTSQEINQLHKNPFDSACVLHSAIQHAALLRQQQQQKKQSSKQAQQTTIMLNGGRRASLSSATHHKNSVRRSSLGTMSLHVSALHNSIERSQPKQHRALQSTQYIRQENDILVEGDW